MSNRHYSSSCPDKIYIEGATSNHHSSRRRNSCYDEHKEKEKIKEFIPPIPDISKVAKPKENNSFIKKILDFIKSDDALLILVGLLILQEGPDDELMLLIIVYLLVSGK